MQVILSNIPGFILKWRLNSKPIKNWVYFGPNRCYLKKLRSIFQEKAAEINYGEELYEKSKSIRSDYVRWLDAVSASYPNNKEWMFSVPAVRNTYTSSLFLNVCYIGVLEEFKKVQRNIDFVFVDSPSLASIFRNQFSCKEACGVIRNFFAGIYYFKSFFRSILRFFRYLIDYVLRFISAKVVFKKRVRELFKNKKSLVFIRSFITDKFSDSGKDVIEKHFFPGLYAYLEDEGCTPVFLPAIVKPTNYINLFKRVFSGKRNIVFLEEFLRVRDYFFAFFAPFRALSIKIKPPVFKGYDIDGLLKEDYYSNLTEAGFLYSTLLYCLGRRLKGISSDPKWIINWTENQSIEKGLIKGLKEWFPDMKVIGAQPFISPPNYLSPVFSRQEKLYGLLPDRVLVLGPLWKNAITEFVDNLKIDYSPAFRYASSRGVETNRIRGNNLFVLLGIDLDNTIHIMGILLEIFQHLGAFDNILIKMHPASNFNKDVLEHLIGEEFPEAFKFVDGELDQYIDDASVGLCGASGTAVELVMRGMPVVTIGETHTLTMNYLDYKEDCDIWRICFSLDQVVGAIKHFQSLQNERPENFAKKANDFRQAFIAEPDEKYWENCLI